MIRLEKLRALNLSELEIFRALNFIIFRRKSDVQFLVRFKSKSGEFRALKLSNLERFKELRFSNLAVLSDLNFSVIFSSKSGEF